MLELKDKMKWQSRGSGACPRKNLLGHAPKDIGKCSSLEDHPKMRNGKFPTFDYLVRKSCQEQDVMDNCDKDGGKNFPTKMHCVL